MIARTTTCGYTDPAREKKRAGLGRPNLLGGQPPAERFFYVRCMAPSMGSRAGHLRMRRYLVAGRPTRMVSPTPLVGGERGNNPNTRRHVMSNLTIGASAPVPFSFESHTVRAINHDGEIWFVAADVGGVLGLGNVRSSLALLDDDESAVHSMDIRSENGVVQKREVNIINESGLYALILRSRKPEAKRFRKWVTSEVLPAIRKTGSYSLTISKAQQGELATLIAERFPSGKDRPYAWSRFNNHFRLASYKDLPTNRFEEACEYIKQMPEQIPALPKPAVNLLDKDYFAKVRDIAIKFADDWVRVGKGEDVRPTLTIPDDVLAGIVAQQLSKHNFRLYVDYTGSLSVEAMPDKSPYEGLAKAIEDRGNIGLSDETIREIGRACVNALAYRAQSRKEGVNHA